MYPINQRAMSPDIIKQIDNAGVIAVLTVEEIKHVLPLGQALLDGGVNTIELTLRTPVALEAAKIIRNEFPDIKLGIGTVLTTKQVEEVVKVGADFAVAPGCNPNVIKAASEHGLSFAPGIMTPSDIEVAVELGCRILKYFPAESSGGMYHLKSMVAPYQYLGLKFIPLGGLNLLNAADYLKSPLITAIGGSWIAGQDLIKEEKWDIITKNARDITSLIRQLRQLK